MSSRPAINEAVNKHVRSEGEISASLKEASLGSLPQEVQTDFIKMKSDASNMTEVVLKICFDEDSELAH